MEKNSNSFLDYLESDQFYDRIYSSIFSFCLGNKELLLDRINGSNVTYITEVEELELEYINVWIDSKGDIEIEFDIAIEVTADVVGVQVSIPLYLDGNIITSSTSTIQSVRNISRRRAMGVV